MNLQTFFIQQIGLGVLLPALITGLSYLVFKRFLAQFSPGLSIAIAFLAAYAALTSIKFPPLSVQQWLPYLLLASLVLGALEQRSFLSEHALARWGLRVLLFNFWLYQIFKTFLSPSLVQPARWDFLTASLHFVAVNGILIGFWLLLEQLLKQSSDAHTKLEPKHLLAVLVCISATASICIALSHSLVTAQLNGSLAASLAMLAVLFWFQSNNELSLIALPPLVMLQFAFLLNAYYFASLPWYVALIALLPLLFLLPTKNFLKTKTQWLGVHLVTLMVFSALSIYLTFQA